MLSVEYDKEVAVKNIEKYKSIENVTREFEIVKAKTEAEMRYLEIKGRDMDIYQTILGYILFDNPLKNNSQFAYKVYEQKDLWKEMASGKGMYQNRNKRKNRDYKEKGRKQHGSENE